MASRPFPFRERTRTHAFGKPMDGSGFIGVQTVCTSTVSLYTNFVLNSDEDAYISLCNAGKTGQQHTATTFSTIYHVCPNPILPVLHPWSVPGQAHPNPASPYTTREVRYHNVRKRRDRERPNEKRPRGKHNVGRRTSLDQGDTTGSEARIFLNANDRR